MSELWRDRRGVPPFRAGSFPAALAESILAGAQELSVDPLELVRELFLTSLPEFVAVALGDTLDQLRRAGSEGVEPP